MRVSKLDKLRVSILDRAFWENFGDDDTHEVDAGRLLHLCELNMDNEEWLYNRKAGTGGVRSLAKAVVCWTLEQELIRHNEDTWLDGQPWRVTTAILYGWWATEPEVEEFFQPVLAALEDNIREYRAELRQWVQENRGS